jgi:hypothetical protein
MTDAIKITGINIQDKGPYPSGDRLLAFFDCEYAGLRFFGCNFIKTAKGGFLAQLPKAGEGKNRKRVAHFADDSIRHALMDAARRAYIAFGGKNGDWGPAHD